MITQTRPKLVMLLFMVTLVFISACGEEEPSRWDEAQSASEDGQAVAEDAVPGDEFNKFFPESSGGLEVVFSQEKAGFAEALLEKDGTEVATLSISDTASNPSAAEKFADSSEELDGYPIVEVGSQGSAVLVADRFQVQVRSKAEDFNQDNRRSWLSAFDLSGLEGLK